MTLHARPAASGAPSVDRAASWWMRASLRYPALSALLTYSSAVYASQGLALLRGLLVASLLGPAGFGLWRVIKLILTYAAHLPFGIVQAMRLELPRAIGAGRAGEAARIAQTAVGATQMIGLAVIAICALAVLGGTVWVPRFPAWLTLFVGLLIAAQLLQEAINAKLQAEEHVTRLGAHLMAFSALALIGMVLGATWAGLAGALAGLLAAYVAPLIWLAWRGAFPAFALPDRATLRLLVHRGAPIWVAWLPVQVLGDIDQWLIALVLGTQALGHYGIAVFFGSLLIFLPYLLRGVYQPFLMRQLGATHDPKALRPYAVKSVWLMGYAAPLAIAAAFFAVDPVVRLALPAYAPGLAAAKVYFLGSFWNMTASMTFMVCLALGRKREWFINTLLAIAAHVVVTALVLRAGWGLVGAAASMGLIFAGYALAQVRLMLRFFEADGGAWRSLMGWLLIAFGACAGVCWGVEAALPLPGDGAGLVMVAIGRAVLGIALLAALYRWADRRLKFSEILAAQAGRGISSPVEAFEPVS